MRRNSVALHSAARTGAAGRPRPAGFTLVEILIVVGIIALLAGLVISVVRGVVGNARAAATKATIRKVDGLLMKRVAAFDRFCDGQDKLSLPGSAPSYARRQLNPGVYSLIADGYNKLFDAPYSETEWSNSSVRPVLLVLARKAYFKQSFPQTLAELNLNTGLSQDAEAQRIAAGSETESSEVLYYSLMNLDSFGVEAGDLDEFKSNEVADVNENGAKEFVDGWQQPLRFYRWPTRLARPVLTASGYGQAQSLIQDNMGDPHDDWHYAHTIPVGVAYGTNGASFNLLISAGPESNATPTRGSAALLSDEHADPLAKDPTDARGRLHPGESLTLPFFRWNGFSQWMESNLHTMDSYHIPLIVSAGIDKQLGLLEPHDLSNFGQLAQPDMSALDGLLDDITNRNLQAGGK